MLARPGCSARLLGIAGKRFSMLSLGDLIQAEGGGPWGTVSIGAPEYTNAPCGPGRTMPCLELALLLVTAPDGPACLLMRRGDDHGPMPGLAVQAVASAAGQAESILADLRALMAEHDVYRGQMITVEADAHGGSTVAFVEPPAMERSEIVLPAGTLERIERHLVAPTATGRRADRRRAPPVARAAALGTARDGQVAHRALPHGVAARQQ